MNHANVSRETSERLDIFCNLFRKWARTINLVAPSTLDRLEDRHIADSLQIAALAPETAMHWADLGTGGGFPGLIVAACQAESHPDRTFTLVESDHRKSAFLRQVSAAMSLNVCVITSRIENLVPLNAAIVSARALAPLSELCAYAERHLGACGKALFLKGENNASEITDARQMGWQFDLEVIKSVTNEGSVILSLCNIHK